MRREYTADSSPGRGGFNLLRMTGIEGNEAIMSWMTRFSCLLIFMSLASALPVNADNIDVPLSKMVQESELIVIGTVTAYVNTGEVFLFERENFKREFPFYKATIKVEKTLKGDPKKSEIDVYSFGTSSEPEFHVQERGIFFIETDRRKSFRGRQSVAGGYAGMLPIEEDTVRPLYIEGEQKKQKLDAFIQRIQKAEVQELR
jgi:hypothetical protein